MDCDRLPAGVALAEIISFQHARDRAAGGQLDHVSTAVTAHPFRVENHLRLFFIEYLEYLLLIGLGIPGYIFLRQRRTRR